eukprot:3947108-Pleurochrysis_carterae.AAC.2
MGHGFFTCALRSLVLVLSTCKPLTWAYMFRSREFVPLCDLKSRMPTSKNLLRWHLESEHLPVASHAQ